MISICTVILGPSKKYLDIYKESIINRTKQVREVLICDLDAASDYYREETIKNIKFKYFGIPPVACVSTHLVGHPFGLHDCIRRATEDYVLLFDPDMFCYSGLDELYLDLYKKYELTFIGISHHGAMQNCSGYFPYVGNLFAKKDKLPDDKFLDNSIKYSTVFNTEKPECDQEFKGKYLMSGVIPEIMHLYPNPHGHCDTGFHLWYWCHLTQGRWLSFPTLDTHSYTSRIYRANFKITDKLPKKKLIWHATSGADARHLYWNEFQEAYKISEEIE